MSTPESPTKRRGCFFYGCLTSLVLLVLVVVFIAVGIHMFNNWIVAYTDSSPMPLPKSDMAPDDLKRLQDRVATFGHALDVHSNTPPLTLTTAEINALLENSEQIKLLKLQNRFYISLESNQINAQISLPLGDYSNVPLIKTAGRYFNGDAVLAASVTNSQLSLEFKSVEIKGQPAPEKFMDWLRFQQEMALTNVNNNPTNQTIFDHIQTAEITNGVLVVTPKP